MNRRINNNKSLYHLSYRIYLGDDNFSSFTVSNFITIYDINTIKIQDYCLAKAKALHPTTRTILLLSINKTN